MPTNDVSKPITDFKLWLLYSNTGNDLYSVKTNDQLEVKIAEAIQLWLKIKAETLFKIIITK